MTPAPGVSTHRGGAEAPPRWVAGTTPYPWPYDGRIDPPHLALLVIRGGGPPDGIAAGGRADPAIESLRRAVSAAGGMVIDAVAHDPRSPAATSHPGTPGSIEAPGWDAFFGTSLDAGLRRAGITHLLLAGGPLETCVHSTMRSANDRGYECLLVVDATVPLLPDLLPRTLSMVEMSGGIFGAIGTTSAVLAQLDPRQPAPPLPAEGVT